MIQFASLISIGFIASTSWANPIIHSHEPISPLTNAVRTGMDNGHPLFLCLGRLYNSVQPGKTWAGHGRCNVPYGGKEYIVDQFSVPDQRKIGRFSWERDRQNALVVGNDMDHKPLFVCQSRFNGSIQPGKTWQGYNYCNISYAGREVLMNDFRVLSHPKEIVVRAAIPPVHRHTPMLTKHSHI